MYFFFFLRVFPGPECLIHRLDERVLDEAVFKNRNKCSENKIRQKKKTKRNTNVKILADALKVYLRLQMPLKKRLRRKITKIFLGGESPKC